MSPKACFRSTPALAHEGTGAYDSHAEESPAPFRSQRQPITDGDGSLFRARLLYRPRQHAQFLTIQVIHWIVADLRRSRPHATGEQARVEGTLRLDADVRPVPTIQKGTVDG